MIARATSLLWLTVVWVALWESASVANVASGLLVGALLLALFPVRGHAEGTGRIRPLAVVRFVAYFLHKLVEANVIVAWEVITPSNASVREGIVAVPVTGSSDAIVAILANAISLTPGTLTLEVERDPTVLYVHVLHLRTADHARADVQRLQLSVLRAFGTEAAIADAERRLAATEAAIDRARETGRSAP
jgi:multicomponent Na+:H+ antiporter subunit E